MGAFVDDDALEVGDGGGGGRRKRGSSHAPAPEMSLQQALKKSWNGLVRGSIAVACSWGVLIAVVPHPCGVVTSRAWSSKLLQCLS